MLNMLQQSGAAWRTLKTYEKFTETLSDDQKEMLSDIKTSLRGIGEGFVPDELKPIFHYVMTDDGEPTVIKAIGAAMHPAVKGSLAGFLPFNSNEDSEHDVEIDRNDSLITIRCRDCGFIAQYDISNQSE